MSQQIHDWIAAQIERAVPGVADVTSVPRLADAASVLIHPRPGGTVFGLELPPGVDGTAALAARCLAVLAMWLPQLDQAQRDEFGLHLRRLSLPALVPPPRERVAAGHVHFFIAATVEDPETEESVDDPAILARLDGASARAGDLLLDLPCLAHAAGVAGIGTPRDGWVCAASASLAYDAEASALRCRLSFGVIRPPSDDELARLATTIESELFFTVWGQNLEWDLGDDDYLVFTKPPIVGRRLG